MTSVFGGDETQRTSSSYNIPEGNVILRVPMRLSDAGSITMTSTNTKKGKLFVTVASGFSSTLKQAGTFSGKRVLEDEE